MVEGADVGKHRSRSIRQGVGAKEVVLLLAAVPVVLQIQEFSRTMIFLFDSLNVSQD